MATVLITGGTGMIGKALTALLISNKYSVILLSRSPQKEKSVLPKGVSYASWDTTAGTIDAAAIQQADYIIHLAGASVAEKRWTKKRKKEIVESRTKSSAVLVQALQTIPNHVRTVISASAIGWYGPDAVVPPTRSFIETDPPHNDFLGEACRLWEESTLPVRALGKRLVWLRLGIVLSTEGGALKEFVKPLRFGIAAILGNGQQQVSWIHIDDVCRMFLYAIENEKLEGAYNAVAPNPVTNKALTLSLAKTLRHKFYIPMEVPSFVLKGMLGELSIEVLKSARVSDAKIKEAGFQFIYPTIDMAVHQLFPKKISDDKK